MSPALHRSSAIRRLERSEAIEIHDGITFDFYTELPHITLGINVIVAWDYTIKYSDCIVAVKTLYGWTSVNKPTKCIWASFLTEVQWYSTLNTAMRLKNTWWNNLSFLHRTATFHSFHTSRYIMLPGHIYQESELSSNKQKLAQMHLTINLEIWHNVYNSVITRTSTKDEHIVLNWRVYIGSSLLYYTSP